MRLWWLMGGRERGFISTFNSIQSWPVTKQPLVQLLPRDNKTGSIEMEAGCEDDGLELYHVIQWVSSSPLKASQYLIFGIPRVITGLFSYLNG